MLFFDDYKTDLAMFGFCFTHYDQFILLMKLWLNDESLFRTVNEPLPKLVSEFLRKLLNTLCDVTTEIYYISIYYLRYILRHEGQYF